VTHQGDHQEGDDGGDGGQREGGDVVAAAEAEGGRRDGGAHDGAKRLRALPQACAMQERVKLVSWTSDWTHERVRRTALVT
jgi:hypothetical protein